MKRNSLVLFCVAMLLWFSGCCTKIDTSEVGIKVNSWGSQRGVEDYPTQVGWVWYNPMTTSIHRYPVFMQNKIWTQDKQEGSPTDESITVNSMEGSMISCDVGLAFTLDGQKVPHLFFEFRQDLDHITHGYLRNKVRDVLNKHAKNYKAVDIIGARKQDMLDEARLDLQEILGEKGFVIDTLSFVSAPRPDDRVKQSITAVIEATQQAIQAENKVKQVKAEADQAVAKAKGKAEAILAEAEAQAKANELLTKSITPELVKYRMLEKWDGVAPKVVGDSAGLILDMK